MRPGGRTARRTSAARTSPGRRTASAGGRRGAAARPVRRPRPAVGRVRSARPAAAAAAPSPPRPARPAPRTPARSRRSAPPSPRPPAGRRTRRPGPGPCARRTRGRGPTVRAASASSTDFDGERTALPDRSRITSVDASTRPAPPTNGANGQQRHAHHRHRVPGHGPRPVPPGPVGQRPGEQPEPQRRGLPGAGHQADHQRGGAERGEERSGHRPGALVDHVGGQADHPEPRHHAPRRGGPRPAHPTSSPQARATEPTSTWLVVPVQPHDDLPVVEGDRHRRAVGRGRPGRPRRTCPRSRGSGPPRRPRPAASTSRIASIFRFGRRRPTFTHHSPTSRTMASATRVKTHGDLLYTSPSTWWRRGSSSSTRTLTCSVRARLLVRRPADDGGVRHLLRVDVLGQPERHAGTGRRRRPPWRPRPSRPRRRARPVPGSAGC